MDLPGRAKIRDHHYWKNISLGILTQAWGSEIEGSLAWLIMRTWHKHSREGLYKSTMQDPIVVQTRSSGVCKLGLGMGRISILLDGDSRDSAR